MTYNKGSSYKNYKDLILGAEPKEKEVKKPSRRTSVLNIDELFTEKEDIKLAREFESKYLEQFEAENISDKNLLKNLIYLEVFQINRLQKTANEFQVTNGVIPIQIVDSLHKNINQICEIKEKLGLTSDKKKESSSDSFRAFELLKKKAKIWREQNQASRTMVCPHCSKMVMLKIRTDIWEAQKHPYFKDRLLGNEHIINLFKQGILTKEDLAKIFEVSTSYAEWLIDKWKLDKKEDTEISTSSNIEPSNELSPISPTQNSDTSEDKPSGVV